MRLKRRSLLLAGLLEALARPLWGQTSQAGLAGAPTLKVLLVSAARSGAYLALAQAMREELAQFGVAPAALAHLTLDEFSTQQSSASLRSAQVWVALGVAASAALAQLNAAIPLLCTLLPRASFARVLRSSRRETSNRLSALYLDQPLSRQLALLRLALPKLRRIGVLWGPDSIAQANSLKLLAQAQQFTLVPVEVDAQVKLFPALRQVLDDCELLLALPDPLVYNRLNIQNILLTSFRRGIPMVGFSPSYVLAGALLSLHIEPAQLGREAALLVSDVLRGKALPDTAQENKHFTLQVNDQVAKAFDLSLDANALAAELRRKERLP